MKLTKEEIIEAVIRDTNWDMMVALRTLAFEYKDYKSHALNNVESLKTIARGLLNDVITKDCTEAGTAMLCAFKEDEGYGEVKYGIRFEAVEGEVWTEEEQWAEIIH